LYSGITCKLTWGRTFLKRKVKILMRHQEQRKMKIKLVAEVKMATKEVTLVLEKKVQSAPKDCLIRVDMILFL